MSIVYVLEGPDGAGKTHYAEELLTLSEYLGYETVYVHNGPSDAKLPGSLFKHYRAQIADAIDRAGHVTVIDRSFLSELVYGRLYRGKARITEWQVRRLERWARRKGVILAAVTAPLELRKYRIAQRGETWDNKQAFVGAFYAQHFHESDSWITVERSSATN